MRFNFRLKLFFAFFLMAFVVSGVLIGFVYWHLRDLPLRLARQALASAAANAAPRFDPLDIERLQQQPTDPGDPLFVKVLGVLREIDEAPPHFANTRIRAQRGFDKDVYLIVPTDQRGVGRLLVTINPDESGRLYDMARFPAMIAGWDHVSVDDELAMDEYGRSYSAYAPIRDEQGRTLALLGIDAPGEAIDAVSLTIATSAALIFALSLVLSLIPAFLIANRLNRPIRLLDEGVQRVAAGDLDQFVPVLHTRDEFEPLIQRFNEMILKLRDRRRLKRSLELAMQVQQALLPQAAPRVGGFEIADRSEYCEQTGGDYYDFISLASTDCGRSAGESQAAKSDHQRIGIAVGDVAGHGVAAALLMASARAALRSHIHRHGDQPGQLLTSVNHQIVDDTDGARFVTLFYGVLDATAQSLAWSSAGHEPLLWYHARTGRVEAIVSTGPPLGILDQGQWDEGTTLHLQPGDAVLLGTDGIREARNPAGDMFGLERVEQLLVRHSVDSASDLHDHVLQAVRDFRGDEPQQDDITLVVIKAVLEPVADQTPLNAHEPQPALVAV